MFGTFCRISQKTSLSGENPETKKYKANPSPGIQFFLNLFALEIFEL
jgi:hypothetical protein